MGTVVGTLLEALVAYQASRRSARPVTRALGRAGWVRANHAGRPVPTAGGVVPVLAATLPSLMRGGGGPGERGAGGVRGAATPVVLTAALAGLLDDGAGGRGPRGLRGHLEAYRNRRELTTALLKAGAISTAALSAAVGHTGRLGALRGLLGAAAATLGANAMNQLDTRPGRAGTAFLAASAAVLALSEPGRRRSVAACVVPLAAATAGWLPLDLRGEAMLGDTGANALGAALGWAAGEGLSLRQLAAWTVSLAVFNVTADRVSLAASVDRLEGWIRRRAAARRGFPAVRRRMPRLAAHPAPQVLDTGTGAPRGAGKGDGYVPGGAGSVAGS